MTGCRLFPGVRVVQTTVVMLNEWAGVVSGKRDRWLALQTGWKWLWEHRVTSKGGVGRWTSSCVEYVIWRQSRSAKSCGWWCVTGWWCVRLKWGGHWRGWGAKTFGFDGVEVWECPGEVAVVFFLWINLNISSLQEVSVLKSWGRVEEAKLRAGVSVCELIWFHAKNASRVQNQGLWGLLQTQCALGVPQIQKQRVKLRVLKREAFQIQMHKVSAGHPRSNHLSGIQSSRTRPLKILPLMLTEEGRGERRRSAGAAAVPLQI